MTIAAELIALKALPVKLGHFVEISLYLDCQPIHRSEGRDEYHINTIIPAGNRFAASGRLCLCQVELSKLGLGPMEVRPAVPVPTTEPLAGHKLQIRTNLFFSASQFYDLVCVRLVENGSSTDLDPNINIITPRPGLFIMIL